MKKLYDMFNETKSLWNVVHANYKKSGSHAPWRIFCNGERLAAVTYPSIGVNDGVLEVRSYPARTDQTCIVVYEGVDVDSWLMRLCIWLNCSPFLSRWLCEVEP